LLEETWLYQGAKELQIDSISMINKKYGTTCLTFSKQINRHGSTREGREYQNNE
jgi:hypothetical protein